VSLRGRGFLPGVTVINFGEGIEVDTLSVKNSGLMEGRIAVHLEAAVDRGSSLFQIQVPGEELPCCAMPFL